MVENLLVTVGWVRLRCLYLTRWAAMADKWQWIPTSPLIIFPYLLLIKPFFYPYLTYYFYFSVIISPSFPTLEHLRCSCVLRSANPDYQSLPLNTYITLPVFSNNFNSYGDFSLLLKEFFAFVFGFQFHFSRTRDPGPCHSANTINVRTEYGRK